MQGIFFPTSYLHEKSVGAGILANGFSRIPAAVCINQIHDPSLSTFPFQPLPPPPLTPMYKLHAFLSPTLHHPPPLIPPSAISANYTSTYLTCAAMGSSFIGITANRTTRRTLVGEDEGLASLADMEAGFSGNNKNAIFSTSSRRRGSYRAFPLSSSSSSSSSYLRSGGLRYEEPHPFLDSCHLCKKHLRNRDIFMYRGNTPFCSDECRQEQIDRDEAEEKMRGLSIKAASRKEQKSSSKPNNTRDFHFRTGTVVAG